MHSKAEKKLSVILIILFYAFLAYGKEVFHILQNGETLYGLSKKYRIPLSVIMEYNEIKDSSRIKAGEKILIPDVYTVEKGETLYGIARKFGVSVDELMRINSLSKNSVIKPGNTLIIPGKLSASRASPGNGRDYGRSAGENSVKSAVPLQGIQERHISKQADPGLIWPVPANKVYYMSGKILGVVIDSKRAESVKAVNSGKVISIGNHRGFGNVVFVQSKNKYIYVYAGMDKISVKKNQKISFNQKLGELGAPLSAGRAQLYFIVYEKNKPIDPAKAPRG